MNKPKKNQPALHSVLASPMRLELVGLFTEPGPLSISDMAARLGRPATSLYHHVQILVEAGVLRQAGTRPKGKRFEAVYEVARNLVDLEVDRADPEAAENARQAMSAALRMADKDFSAAMERQDIQEDGPGRNLLGMRVHIRASEEVLAGLNERLDAVHEYLAQLTESDGHSGADDQFVSLTLLLAPLRGRRSDSHKGE
jgi:DNA-binding Lrp family transcriptional regulator